jgi:Non-histone chromosomal protein MC1
MDNSVSPVKLVDQGVYLAVGGLYLNTCAAFACNCLRYTAREIDLYRQTIRAYRSLCRSCIMAENEKRNFALRNVQGDEIGVFTGKQPRQAALKAANRGYTEIKLRERGTKKVHVFTGEKVLVDKPKGAPAWMPDKIWKPKVKKVGIEKLE